MRVVWLEAGLSAFERGERHGRALGDEIAEIARIRSELACSQGLFRSDAELLRVAELHLPILERYDRSLYDELCGVAVGCDQPAARIVVLNHYTDLKDLDPKTVLRDSTRPPARPHSEPEEDCSAIVAGTPEGPLLGQTWDMHGSAGRFVVMLHVPADEGRPAAWLLSIAGCLGMAGLNALGVGVTINNLRSNDARVGLVWPALVRRILRESDAMSARAIVESAPLGSGHHYLVADERRAFGIETSGHLADTWMELDLRARGAFHHENHCLGAKIAGVSSISPVSTTLERHAWIEKSLRDSPIAGRGDLWARLGSHDGYPRSVCTHLATDEHPHAMKTCAGIVMNLAERRIWAVDGCVHDGTPMEMTFAS